MLSFVSALTKRLWTQSVENGAPDKQILLQLEAAVSDLYDQLMDYETLQARCDG